MKGENCTTSFLPLDNKKDGPLRYVKDREAISLTEEQMRHLYKKVEAGSEVNIDTIKQEIDNDKLSRSKIVRKKK